MEYINQADYARSISMGHIKFASRALNIQLDMNPSLTEMYQKILRFSNSTIPVEYIDKLTYTLNPPRALITQNNADNINTADQLILAIIKTKVGENDSSDESNLVRDIMYNALARDHMPSLDWAHIDEVYKDSVLKAKKQLMENEDNNE